MEKNSTLDKITRELSKKYGRTTVARLSEIKALVNERVPTGSLSLDLVLGGGLPLGRIIEFYGTYSSGKTLLSLKTMASFQKRGLICAYVDMEGSLQSESDILYLESLGVDTSNLLVTKPGSSEESIEVVVDLIKSGINLIVYDSIAMSTPERVFEKNDDTIGIEAKRNNLLVRKIIATLQPKDLLKKESAPKCSVIIINQLRDSIGTFNAPPSPSGGWGLKFAKHISIEIKRTSYLDDKESEVIATEKEKYGQEIKMISRKNKTFHPYLVGVTRFYFRDIPDLNIKEKSIDKAFEILEYGVKYGIIQRGGYWFTIGDQKFQGKVAARKYLRENPKIMESLEKEIKETFLKDYSKIEDKTLTEDPIVERKVKDENTEQSQKERKENS